MQSVRVNFECTKRLFNLSAEAIINARKAPLCALFLLKIEQYSFFLSRVQVVYVYAETPKSIQDSIGDAFCPGKYCFNRENFEYLDGYVRTLRSIYGCGKCGAWLFV